MRQQVRLVQSRRTSTTGPSARYSLNCLFETRQWPPRAISKVPLYLALLLPQPCVVNLIKNPSLRELMCKSWKLLGHNRKVTLTIAWLQSDYYPTLST